MMMLLMMSGRTPRPETTSPLSLTLPLLRTRRPAQAYVNGLNAASEQMEAAQAKGAPFSRDCDEIRLTNLRGGCARFFR